MVKLSTVDLDGIAFLAPGPQDPSFAAGFFDRIDPTPDSRFYDSPRLVTHIDRAAMDAVGALYHELAVRGEVLDVMSSWISHFREGPQRLIALGLNDAELRHNRQAAEVVVRDLNADPTLPFPDASFDDAVCCVSIDYLVQPVAVFREVGRVLRPSGRFVVTFSDRCFPTKAIRGWLEADDAGHIAIVRRYFELSAGFGPVEAELRTDPGSGGDPLYAVWAGRVAGLVP